MRLAYEKGGDTGLLVRRAMIGKNAKKSVCTQGFSLIEAAIVLGVVGLVIGGIWTAASSVSEGHKISETVNGIIYTVRRVQGLISMQDAEAIGDEVYITDALIASKAFPSNWINGNFATNPFGGSVTSWTKTTSTGQRFSLFLDSIPRAPCIKLVVKLSSIGMPMRENDGSDNFDEIRSRPLLRYLAVNGKANWETFTFPVSAAVAETACNQDSNLLESSYNYARVN